LILLAAATKRLFEAGTSLPRAEHRKNRRHSPTASESPVANVRFGNAGSDAVKDKVRAMKCL